MGKAKTASARRIGSWLGLMIAAVLIGLLTSADGASVSAAASASQASTGTGTGTTGTSTTSGTIQMTAMQMVLNVLLEEFKGLIAERFGNNLTAQEQDFLAVVLLAEFLDHLFMQSMGGMVGQSTGGFGGWGRGGFGSWGQ
jgi:hypothetical protein